MLLIAFICEIKMHIFYGISTGTTHVQTSKKPLSKPLKIFLKSASQKK